MVGQYGDMEETRPGKPFGERGRVWTKAVAPNVPKLEFGVSAFSYFGMDDMVWGYKSDNALIVANINFAISNVIRTVVNIDGVEQAPVDTTYITTHALTMDQWKADLEAIYTDAVITLIDPDPPGDNRSLRFELNGYEIGIVVTVTLGATQPSFTYTYTSNGILIGITQYTNTNVSGENYYEATKLPALVQREHEIYVVVPEAVKYLDPVKIFENGVNMGKFGISGTRDTPWIFTSSADVSGYARIEIK